MKKLSIHTENENLVYQLFGNDVIFRHRVVLVSDYYYYYYYYYA